MPYPQPHTPHVLLVEDSPSDQRAIRKCLDRTGVPYRMNIVENGRDAIDYLARRGVYADPAESPRPDFVLLDLNLPIVDGRGVLAAVKADPQLKTIPIVVLTTSARDEDVEQSYRLGGNAYVTKPVDMETLVEAVAAITRFWFGTALLPKGPAHR